MSEKKYKICFGTQSYPANDEMINNNISRSEGIYIAEFDAQTGDLSNPRLMYPTKTSSFFAYDELNKILYVSGIIDLAGSQDEVAALRYFPSKDGNNDKLVLLNAIKSGGKTACHLSFDPSRHFLAVANYSSGSLNIFRICPDGSIGPSIFFQEYHGSGPNPKRQEQSHVHSVYFLKTENSLRLFALDLGRDAVVILKHDPARDQFIPDSDIPLLKLCSGCGPRHAAFLPANKFLTPFHKTCLTNRINISNEDQIFFVLNELNSTLAIFYLEFRDKHLDIIPLGCQSVIPDDFRRKTSNRSLYFGSEAAEIEITESSRGPVLYCSNRGHNSISVFTFDQLSFENTDDQNDKTDFACSLSEREKTSIQLNCHLVQTQSTFGVFPRFFSTDPEEKWLIVDNERSGSILVFKRDPLDGHLHLINKEPQKIAWPLAHVFLR